MTLCQKLLAGTGENGKTRESRETKVWPKWWLGAWCTGPPVTKPRFDPWNGSLSFLLSPFSPVPPTVT